MNERSSGIEGRLSDVQSELDHVDSRPIRMLQAVIGVRVAITRAVLLK